MALKEFSVKKGILVTDNFSCLRPTGFISGTGEPGGDTSVQDDAGLSMIYADTSTGDLYRKISISNNNSNDWELIGSDQGVTENSVTTSQNIDSIKTKESKGVEWEIEVENVDSPEDRFFFKLFAGHNATSLSDATQVDSTEYAVLCFGNEFDYSYTLNLTGVGADQKLDINFASTETNGINVTLRKTVLK